MEVFFGLMEDWEEQESREIVCRRTGKFLGRTCGFELGDGGPYIRCLKKELAPDLRYEECGVFYSLVRGGHARGYWQLRGVADRPNPPRYAKYSDPRNRPFGEGYAWYATDSVYFDPDEVCVVQGTQDYARWPLQDLPLRDLVLRLGPMSEELRVCFWGKSWERTQWQAARQQRQRQPEWQQQQKWRQSHTWQQQQQRHHQLQPQDRAQYQWCGDWGRGVGNGGGARVVV
jgi:hypothetical protein